MGNIVDARGLSCPQPVIRTRAAMKEAGNDAIVTIVDNDVAMTNVSRMAEKSGWAITVERKADGIYVALTRGDQGSQPAETQVTAPVSSGRATLLLVKSDCMGTGDDELGCILMRGFFHTLLELDELPATIVFLNSGVKLAVKESPVLEDVQTLESRGVEILVCGTCLNHFELIEQLGAGIVSNMYSITEALMAAGKVISP